MIVHIYIYYTKKHILLLGKPPLPHKTQKNNAVLHCQGAPADEISLLKGFLHNCGRVGISFRQLKKLSRITECMLLFQNVKKTHEQFCV